MAGGNIISYKGITSTPIVGMTTIKIYQNLVISTPNAKYTILGIKDFYLNSKLDNYKHMKILTNLIPEEFIELCKLRDIVD